MRLFTGALLALALALVLTLTPALTPASAAASAKHAPDRPPLATGSGSGTGAGGRGTAAEEASASAPTSGGDPLQSNGLNSPLCRDAVGELSGAAARNCRSSGFEGARAPTGDYGIDVHIGTGLTHIVGNQIADIVQELLELWWSAMVAVVRGVIVVLDWCYTLDLLNGPAMGGVARGLSRAHATFTRPWMAIVLSLAAVAALYHGLIRRRVAQTLGEAVLMVVMMGAGLWVIMSPKDTIGALGAWANEASLGALAAVRAGSMSHPYRTLGESDEEVFGAAINAPWCFIEFGDVGWCDAPVEPRLRKAALRLAAHAKPGAEGVSGGSSSYPLKAVEGSIKLVEGVMGAGEEEPETIHVSPQSAALLRDADTNGELFLALPANGPARNSLSNDQSLFYVLCGGGEEPCGGPTAGEAQYRTQSGTWSRGIGMTLVAFGVLGMVLLLGFIAWRLLYAAFMSLVYLLLTPVAVLAPALGENGRAAFRTWGMRLLAAVTSKLIYSFLLGAVLMVERGISELQIFGWLTQWLMLSSLWWIVYLRRHRLFEFATGTSRAAGAAGAQQRSVLRRVSDVLESRKGVSATRWAKRRLGKPAPSVDRNRTLAQAGRERAQQIADTQVADGLDHQYRQANELAEEGGAAQERISAKRTRLDRMQAQMGAWMSRASAASGARSEALGELGKRRGLAQREAELKKRALAGLQGEERKGRQATFEKKAQARERRMDHLRRTAAKRGAQVRSHHRRAAALQGRMSALRAEIDRDQARLTGAKQQVKAGGQAESASGGSRTRAREEEEEEFGRYLDEQARLPRSRRDHAGMAGVVGMTPGEYERLSPREQLKTRLGIDRQLAKRERLGGAVAEMEARAGASPVVGWWDKQAGGKELESKVGGASESRVPPARARYRGSSVLNDAHEVWARHKRQLGHGRR